MTNEQMPIGSVVWQDLTVNNTEVARDFYSSVVGWQSRDIDMGDYSDFEMISPTNGDSITGICHARGANADLPAQWLVYFSVASVEASVQQCIALGGAVLVGPKPLGDATFCVIRDPVGAVCALMGPN